MGFIADLSHHLIAITTAFSGTEVLLFGAVESSEVTLLLSFEARIMKPRVRRKNRYGFVGSTPNKFSFRTSPVFYALATNRPLHEIADTRSLQRHQIGAQNLELNTSNARDAKREDLDAFRSAFLRVKERAGLYVKLTDAGPHDR